MADSATGTITAAIDAYQAGDADELLKEFHTDARVVGTRKPEKWDKKSKAKKQIETDMAAITYGGAFVNSAVKSGELKQLGDGGAMLFHRSGAITVKTGKKSQTRDARWTVVVQQYADGWKIKHSHFSFDEN